WAGGRPGAAWARTGLADARRAMKVVCEEVFGPVATVQPYDGLAPLFERVSAEPYGLHAGIFTKSLAVALDAVRKLRVGGVIVNGTSTWRTDQLAYGGGQARGTPRP